MAVQTLYRHDVLVV